MIDDLGRKIRLDVKPDSKKGSGGGSENLHSNDKNQYCHKIFIKVDLVSEEDLQFGIQSLKIISLQLHLKSGLSERI